MIIYLASDHAGIELKKTLLSYLGSQDYKVEDLGAYALNPEDDYPDFVSQAAERVSNDSLESKAIIVGASGQGEAMAANRFLRVRAAVYYGGTLDIIKKTREDNDSNVLSLGARFISIEEAQQAVILWLETPFSNQARHIRRINKY